jgi:hypothetical protein
MPRLAGLTRLKASDTTLSSPSPLPLPSTKLALLGQDTNDLDGLIYKPQYRNKADCYPAQYMWSQMSDPIRETSYLAIKWQRMVREVC